MSPQSKKNVPEKELKVPDPYKKGDTFCDMKVVAYDKDSVRPVHFVYVKRGALIHVPAEKGAPGTVEWSERAIARTPQGKVIWNTEVHMMTVGDFKNHIEERKKVEAGVA